MHARTSARLQRQGLAWLLWAALWLVPLAQSLAAWHEVSHLRTAAAQGPDERGVPHKACELCLLAAAVDHGGPPAAPVLLALADAAPSVQPAPAPPAPRLAPLAAYRSRAPPTALR